MFPNVESENQEAGTLPLPFILNYMEEKAGAVSFTTSGTYDNPDGADNQ